MIPTLELLREREQITALDLHFARAVGRLADETREVVLLAAAMTSAAVRAGDTCLVLGRLQGEVPSQAPDQERAAAAVSEETELVWPAQDSWSAALSGSSLIGDGAQPTPLVMDGSGRLYLYRYWRHQQRVAAAIHERAAITDQEIDQEWLRQGLTRLFGSTSGDLDGPDWQRVATMTAVLRRFTVISGGPGTGKTFTVAKVLALLVELALNRGLRPGRGPHQPHITLVAPTGKAADRLAKSIGGAVGELDCDQEVRQLIPTRAATIHRCLGTLGGSLLRFRHHADNPLPSDVVLVDEASMVDLGLMARLVEALQPHARLILLGDRDQLASVDAGAVLGDICNTGGSIHASTGLTEQARTLAAVELPADAGAPPQTGIWDCVVQLSHSYRFTGSGGIGLLARAVQTGQPDAAIELLKDPVHADVRLCSPDEKGLGDLLSAEVVEGYRAYLEAEGAVAKLNELDSFRVLCAHRRGPSGVEQVNPLIAAALEAAGLLRVDGPYFLNRPVMVTRNDYNLGLFNGDVGLILPAEESGEAPAACFPVPGEAPRVLAPSWLPPHETVFAMTVHKSQGSEFDHVVVLLPPRCSPVLTRELVYTAVTRARDRVSIYADEEVLREALAARTQRASGLRDLLWPAP